MRKKYLLLAPSYDENVGGAISMHRLCHLLNSMGEEAYLWHDGSYTFRKNPEFNTPELFTSNLEEFIVIYMEVVNGNPLDCPNVVRWFLNKPGFFTGNTNYGQEELYFFFQEVFNHKAFVAKDKLYVAYFLTDLFYNKGSKSREGSCYMMRKGRGREIQHDLTGSIMIDGMSHQEIAKIFNSKKYFYCYDLHSAYTYFASLCGCTPIVVPEKGVDEYEWQPEERLRYGVAYGDSTEQLAYAKNTAPKLAKLIDELAIESQSYVANFVKKTQSFFLSTRKSPKQIENERLEYFEALKSSNNKVVFFGASEALRSMYSVFKLKGLDCDYLCDNSESKFGSKFLGKVITDPNELFNSNGSFDVLITSSFHREIKSQLKRYESVKNIYSLF